MSLTTGSQNPLAVVLLSGGLDSSTVLALARRDGFTPCALTFRYGQRHEIEIESANRVAQAFGIEKQIVVDINLRQFGGSALTSNIEVPKGRSADEMSHGVPITYVPARNTILLSLALAWAEVLGAQHIFFGANAVAGYASSTPEASPDPSWKTACWRSIRPAPFLSERSAAQAPAS